ncbi:sulfate ABC transporter substrate-binding protein [Solimonas marina]|uniref:Sulfate ABC transporter substrate-binding protein n=1 Tax=Solimonas marina TaxID=2714601 RepID=A0A970B5G3_9GAMM|nr:sulfate ABC transporter substrate-binding protein [Solimonas marina]NKF21683.1 sulfate ABC transporter substrate-binding protein [Solimonas marina]
MKYGFLILTISALLISRVAQAEPLLNASYDVARDFYRQFNPAFTAYWKQKTGTDIIVQQSHGGSSKQARAVIDGLDADVLTTNNPLDIDAVAAAGLVGKDWARRFAHHASPSWSTILFLVRKGNPKHIHDWNDLTRADVRVIMPNPKTSGNGRYSYLAAWQYALTLPGGDDATARHFVAALLHNVPVFDTGGRGATTTFVQRGVGDVLLTFENELFLIRKEFGDQGFEIVAPSISIRADNPVAVVDKVATEKGNTTLARAYLEYHYSHTGQELLAANGLRPADETVLAEHAAEFPKLRLFSIDDWPKTYAKHFADGGVLDQLMTTEAAGS